MLREFEQTRNTSQVAADQIAGDLYQDTSVILAKQGVSKRKVASAILQGLGQGLFVDPRFLSADELFSIRTLKKEVDFGDDGVKNVRLTGYGWDKKKNQPNRTFVFISEFPHYMEIREDHAVMWDIKSRGKRTFHHRGGRADIEEVNLYKQTIDRLQAS